MLSIAEDGVGKSDCSRSLWLPYKKNKEDEWAIFDGSDKSMLPEFFKQPPWLVWNKGQPNGLHFEDCTKAIIGENARVYDTDCREFANCYICEFEDITTFNIRGLCGNLKKMLDLSRYW